MHLKSKMKKIIIGIAALTLFIACKKLDDPAENPPRGDSYLKFIHVHPTAPALDIYSQYYNQTNKIGSNLTHKNALPSIGYMKLQSSDKPSASGVGTYWIHTQPALTADTFHKPTPILLERDSYQTIFNIDSAGTPKLLIFNDILPKLDSGFYAIRFFNAKFNSGNMTLTTNNNSPISADFMQLSNFIILAQNVVNFTLKDANGNIVDSLNNFSPRNKKTYTFFYSDSLYVTQQSD